MTQSIEYLDVHDLLEIARALIPGVQVRDLGLLQSAAARPASTVFGDEAYKTFTLKVAALMHSIGRNHALIDGNKRLAWAAGRTFCLLNGYDLRFSVDDAEMLIQGIAQGQLDVSDIEMRLRDAMIASPNN